MLNFNSYPSKLIDEAVAEFSKLPGIGSKTALRLVLHLLKEEETEVERFGQTMIEMRRNIKQCRLCHNISDNDICHVCANSSRDHATICVVESIKDVMAIENTQQYQGVYHVLGGKISPMDGIGPADLNIDTLLAKTVQGTVNEVILALSTTMEGDTTNFYLYKKLKNFPLKITTLARGVAIGDELEYTDELTLGRSILNRTEFSM